MRREISACGTDGNRAREKFCTSEGACARTRKPFRGTEIRLYPANGSSYLQDTRSIMRELCVYVPAGTAEKPTGHCVKYSCFKDNLTVEYKNPTLRNRFGMRRNLNMLCGCKIWVL